MVVGVASVVAAPGVVVSGAAGAGAVVADAEGSSVPGDAGSEGDRLGDTEDVGGGGDEFADAVGGALSSPDSTPGWALVVARACAACWGSVPSGVCWMP